MKWYEADRSATHEAPSSSSHRLPSVAIRVYTELHQMLTIPYPKDKDC